MTEQSELDPITAKFRFEDERLRKRTAITVGVLLMIGVLAVAGASLKLKQLSKKLDIKTNELETKTSELNTKTTELNTAIKSLTNARNETADLGAEITSQKSEIASQKSEIEFQMELFELYGSELPETMKLIGKGLEAARQGKRPDAIRSYCQVVKKNEKSVLAFKLLGAELSRERRYDKALEPLTLAVTLDGRDAEAWHYYSLAMWEVGAKDIAAAAVTRSIDQSIDPDREMYQRARERKSFEPLLEYVSQVNREGAIEIRDDFETSGIKGPRMIVLPTGSFKYDEQTVTVESFALGKFEVTFDEYDEFVNATGNNQRPGDDTWGRGDRPVINVSWNDAIAYTKWLSEQTGENYRLPTDIEWEFAASAGSKTNRYWSPEGKEACKYANVVDEGNIKVIQERIENIRKSFPCNDGYAFTAPVGQFKANQWGLKDMLGNVWELNQRCFFDSRTNTPCATVGVRGGSFYTKPEQVTSDFRDLQAYKTNKDFETGFRVARTLFHPTQVSACP